MNSFSIVTASEMIAVTRSCGSWLTSLPYSMHAKSVCSPSSRLISSLLKQRPGIIPRFLSQKIAQKLPLKKMPSTAANATSLSAKLAVCSSHHFRAQLAFFCTQGTVSMALNSFAFSTVSCEPRQVR